MCCPLFQHENTHVHRIPIQAKLKEKLHICRPILELLETLSWNYLEGLYVRTYMSASVALDIFLDFILALPRVKTLICPEGACVRPQQDSLEATGTVGEVSNTRGTQNCQKTKRLQISQSELEMPYTCRRRRQLCIFGKTTWLDLLKRAATWQVVP